MVGAASNMPAGMTADGHEPRARKPRVRSSAAAGAARKTQAERSSLSQEKILKAAIRCLGNQGYAATTIHLIAKTADMTTGRLQHQFATKADVMAAVIRRIQSRNVMTVALSGLKAEAPVDRLKEYLRHLAAVFDRKDVIAVYEIRLALKGDAELDRTVGPLLREADTTSFAELQDLIAALGMSDESAGMWRRLILAALRGAALERVARYGAGRVPILQPLERIAEILAGDSA